ncbi:SGNH/GDSL hydrolase family protein [Streptomyces sp. NPDC101062]|uniref:SGNH/GDSL hydrolase family protein n=1 Tax=unclassified Streptomyces TaxID=2593676 RepID=UPI00380EE283
MHRSTRTPALLALFSLLVSLLVLLPAGTASAAESIPPLQWPAPSIGRLDGSPVASTNGDITLPCATVDTGSDLITYNASGQVVRQISRTSVIDGVTNCMTAPIADKNGDIYGVPFGKNASNNWTQGPNLLAYAGNTLKWKYPLSCGYDTSPSYAVGANGNIYSTARLSDGVHLIGLTPEAAAGQIAPTKVLDVKISNDCSMMLRTYKDGIVLHGQSSGNAWYYSYSGKFLGQATIGDVWYEKQNAEGQLFAPSYVSGSGFKSTSVSRYDPTTGAVKWTVSASQPGADTNGVQLFPTPGGGVVVLLTEQDMVSDGVPATPKTWHKALVTINASGQKVRSILLSDSIANSNNNLTGTFGGTYLTAESGGKVVVVREMNVDTGISYPATMPGISVQTYDPVNNTWPYQQQILGDPNAPGGRYGYALDTVSQQPANAVTNTLYVRARCSGGCAYPTPRKLFALTVNGLGTDYPQGPVITANTATQPVPRSYVALGDSFSSGEGDPPFVDTTACNRSSVAYPRVNGLNPNLTLQLDKFVACSGAQTTHVLNGWNDSTHYEPSQVSALSSGSPKVATITIGGNDIFFTDFAKACVLDTCNFSSAKYNTSLNAINNTLGTSLTTTYKKLLEVTKTAGTKVYVLGYPQVIANKTITDPGDARCPYMYESVPVASGRYWEDARAARDIVTKLNTKISDTVNAVRALDADNQRLVFVSATGTNSPFAGHEVCGTGESYFNNVDQALNGLAYVFHPNEKGQAAYAQLVRQAIGE